MIASSVRWRRWDGSRACQALSSTDTSSRARSAGRLGSSAGSSARSRPLHLLANRRRVVAVLDVEVRPEELDHGQVRGRLAVRDRGAVHDEPALAAMRLHDLPDEPRLADARLPDDGHDLAVAGGGPGQRVAQLLQLGTPPDQRRHGTARRQARALEPFEPIARPTPRVDGADGHELEPSLERPARRRRSPGSCPARRPPPGASSAAYAWHVAATSITRRLPRCARRGPELAWIAISRADALGGGGPRALGGLPHRDRRRGPPAAGHPRSARARRPRPPPAGRAPRRGRRSSPPSRRGPRGPGRSSGPTSRSGGGTRMARRNASWRRSQAGALPHRTRAGMGASARASSAGHAAVAARADDGRAPPESELLDPVPERAARDLQPGRGPRDVPVSLVGGPRRDAPARPCPSRP